MKRILGMLAASAFRGVAGASAVDFRFQGGRQTVFLSGACIIGKNGKRAEAASADRFPTRRRFQLRMGAAPNAALIFRLCHRKWLMLFSLKLQKDNRQNALAVYPAEGKPEKRPYFHRAVEMKQPHAMTGPQKRFAEHIFVFK